MERHSRSHPPLPRSIDELSADWLTGALIRAGIEAHVESLEQTRIIWGTATKVFMTATYRGDTAHNLPTQLCIKGGFDEESRSFGLGPAYELEGRFYHEIAPALGVPLPHCLSAEVEPEQGVLVFEDMSPRGVRFPDVLDALSLDDVARSLEVMASWQAATWGARAPRRDWLPIGCRAARTALEVLLGDQMFAALTGRELVPSLPAGLRDAASVRAAYQALWREDDRAQLTLSHGDAHIGQTYVDPQQGPAFLDWQGVCLAPWASDVAYFIGGSLTAKERRSHERELLEHYRGALLAAGGPQLAAEEAWLSYRKHTLHGFIWAVTPVHMQPEPIVTELAGRYLAAIDDHLPTTLLR